MTRVSYWSYSHICYLKISSYSYVNDNQEDDRFLPTHKNAHIGWYHDCRSCKGMFELSQWKRDTIWYHTACTDNNKSFFKNIKKNYVIKSKGLCIYLFFYLFFYFVSVNMSVSVCEFFSKVQDKLSGGNDLATSQQRMFTTYIR